MAITLLSNLASVTYNGASILSNSVNTQLLLPPILLKSVDKLTASIGDIITYTIVITNAGLPAITSLPFRDALPAGCVYVAGSFTLNGSTATPTDTANVLTFTIPNIPSVAAAGAATITFQATITGV